MARTELDFISQAYKQPARELNSQTCVNWYATTDNTGKFNKALFPFPGAVLWADDDSNKEVRGLYELNNVVYAVVDDEFRLYNLNGNYQHAGTMKSSTGPVRMMANDNQVFITDGFEGYVYQLVKTESRNVGDFFVTDEATSSISDPVFSGAGIDDMTTSGTYTGSTDKKYRVQIDGTGSPDTFRWSDSDGTTWNASTVAITGSDQSLNDGVQIKFGSTTGHTQNDLWTFDTTVDNEFYPPLVPAYLDNSGIYIKQNTTRWYLSEINDFSVVNALNFAKGNTLPDNIVAGVVIRQELIFFCRKTTEIWYYTGSAAFPLQRRSNFLNTYGCIAPYSLAVADNNDLFWLGQNNDGGRIVLGMSGYDPQIVSTEPINAELQSYHTVSDAQGFVIQWDGHIFYFLTFPTEDKTWVFDKTTGAWYERSSRRTADGPYTNEWIDGRYRANNYVYFNGKHLIGDYRSGKIFELSRDAYEDYDDQIICEGTTRPFQKDLNRTCAYSLEIDFESAVGPITGDAHDTDPDVMLRISKDGRSFGKEMWRKLGKEGEYKRRAKWNVLGVARSWVFKTRISAKVFKVLLGAVADMEDTGM